MEDHPRGCGEHPLNSMPTSYPRGSSPRMRGAPRFINKLMSNDRIIPADAGSTCHGDYLLIYRGIIPADAGSTESHAPCAIGIGDHPRGCGEHGVCVIWYA